MRASHLCRYCRYPTTNAIACHLCSQQIARQKELERLANQLLICPFCKNPQLKVWIRWHYRTSTAVFATPQVDDGSIVYFCTEGAISATNRQVDRCSVSCTSCGIDFEPSDQEWSLVINNAGEKQTCTIKADRSLMEEKL